MSVAVTVTNVVATGLSLMTALDVVAGAAGGVEVDDDGAGAGAAAA